MRRQMHLSTDGEQTVIEQHLREHAAGYWLTDRQSAERADGQAVPELIHVHRRLTGRLYWYRIAARGGSRTVIAKITDPSGAPRDRLRLVTLVDDSHGFVDEYQALRRIQAAFVSRADPRIGHVPILDHVPAVGAIVMEQVVGTPMNRLLLRPHRPWRGEARASVLSAAHGAGLWLRAFHDVDVAPREVDRRERQEFVEAIERYVDHLASLRPADASRLRALRTVVRTAAARYLPEQLPVAVAHGDFAMRNVMVQPPGVVVVLDTLARRQAPIYEDLATFDVDLRYGSFMVFGPGLVFPSDLADAVTGAMLRGYFQQDERPTRALQLYRLLVLVDRWAALLSRSSGASLRRRPARWLARRAIRREVWRTGASLTG